MYSKGTNPTRGGFKPMGRGVSGGSHHRSNSDGYPRPYKAPHAGTMPTMNPRDDSRHFHHPGHMSRTSVGRPHGHFPGGSHDGYRNPAPVSYPGSRSVERTHIHGPHQDMRRGGPSGYRPGPHHSGRGGYIHPSNPDSSHHGRPASRDTRSIPPMSRHPMPMHHNDRNMTSYQPRPRRNTKWEQPITKQEISQFFSQYATFIISAKAYHTQSSSSQSVKPLPLKDAYQKTSPAIVPPQVTSNPHSTNPSNIEESKQPSFPIDPNVSYPAHQQPTIYSQQPNANTNVNANIHHQQQPNMNISINPGQTGSSMPTSVNNSNH